MPDARKQAEAVAKWMGIVWDASRCEICGWTFNDPRGCVPFHCSERPAPATRAIDRVMPPYADSLDAWPHVEELLAERGLMPQYIEALRNMWFENQGRPDYFEFLIRATPAQRLAAAAKVIEEVERAG